MDCMLLVEMIDQKPFQVINQDPTYGKMKQWGGFTQHMQSKQYPEFEQYTLNWENLFTRFNYLHDQSKKEERAKRIASGLGTEEYERQKGQYQRYMDGLDELKTLVEEWERTASQTVEERKAKIKRKQRLDAEGAVLMEEALNNCRQSKKFTSAAGGGGAGDGNGGGGGGGGGNQGRRGPSKKAKAAAAKYKREDLAAEFKDGCFKTLEECQQEAIEAEGQEEYDNNGGEGMAQDEYKEQFADDAQMERFEAWIVLRDAPPAPADQRKEMIDLLRSKQETRKRELELKDADIQLRREQWEVEKKERLQNLENTSKLASCLDKLMDKL